MYFALPKSNERPSSTQLSNTMADDRIAEIIHNLDDHWGSPPILTPNTLTHILNTPWVDHEKTTVVFNMQQEDTAIFTLIEEMIKALESIKTESLANDIKNDPIIQKYMISKRQGQQGEDVVVVLQHVIALLQHHNKMHTL